ncbi:hypothetical protein L1887_04402 [Cichorium endivia]|nr:hypothetical protein L1887_04402 [Cichorium endivia]
MGTSCSSKKFSEFVFDASDEVAEEKSRWSPTKSGKKTSRFDDSPVDNYKFLQFFAGGKDSKGKKLRDETVTIHEVDEAVKERIFRSDTALQSSSSNNNSKGFSGSKYSDFNTPKPRKAATQLFHLDDIEPVSISDDDDDDNSSTMFSNDLADTEGSSGEESLVQEITPQEMESGVVVNPTYVECGKNCYWKAKLTFYGSSIKLDVSEKEESMSSLTFEWKIVDLICIESRWLEPLITADVCLHIKSEHPKQAISDQKSGILKVNFIISDSNWSFTQELIKSLNEQYKEKWDVDLDLYESFEDITYRGDCDSISITKRDFQLLDPEKFINDTIVDFYIEYLKRIKPGNERIHFFNSFFFRKLADFDENQFQMFDAKSAFQRVRKWTKKVNVFQKDYIIIPVNFRLHWSLIVICHPGEVVNFKDEELEVSTKVPCILHMDSIKGSHRGLENCIKCYLWEEWKERSNHTSEYISTKFMNMRFLRLEVPQQQNSYDCGLFMLHYMELFMKQAPIDFNPLSNFISKDWFYSTEASLKRVRIKRLIVELAKSKSEQVLSPNINEEEPSEVNEEEVEFLHETCNSKETCHESEPDISKDVTPIMELDSQCEEIQETGDNGGSVVADNEQNHGQLVLYDPSVAVVVSPTKESDGKEVVDKQVTVAGNGKANKMDAFMTNLDKSLNILQLKENYPCGRILGPPSTSGGDAHVVEEKDEVCPSSSDDDVFETCVVEDSDSDDSGQPPCYRGKYKSDFSDRKVRKNRLSLQASKRRHHVDSEAQKRLRRSSPTDLQVISLCE